MSRAAHRTRTRDEAGMSWITSYHRGSSDLGFRPRRPTGHVLFVTSLFLCVLTSLFSVGCGAETAESSGSPSVEVLRRDFPRHAERVLRGSEPFVAVGDGFAPALTGDPTAAIDRRGGLSAALPKRGED